MTRLSRWPAKISTSSPDRRGVRVGEGEGLPEGASSDGELVHRLDDEVARHQADPDGVGGAARGHHRHGGCLRRNAARK